VSSVIAIPALPAAAVLAGLAVLAWKRAPVAARILLGATTALVLAALAYPGASVDEIVREGPGVSPYLAGLARVAGGAAGLWALLVTLRQVRGV
jgi:hypothetical protein